MSKILNTLSNKLHCNIVPCWKYVKQWVLIKYLNPKDVLTELPEDVDFIESYIFNYNHFIPLDRTGNIHVHIFYLDFTNLAEIQAIVTQIKDSRERFFEDAHSDAISPVRVGTLTSSVKVMPDSHYFNAVFK